MGHGLMGHRYRPVTQLTHPDLLTRLTYDPYDPLTRCQLCFWALYDLLDAGSYTTASGVHGDYAPCGSRGVSKWVSV